MLVGCVCTLRSARAQQGQTVEAPKAERVSVNGCCGLTSLRFCCAINVPMSSSGCKLRANSGESMSHRGSRANPN